MTGQAQPAPPIPEWTLRQVVQATLLVVAIGLAFWLLFANRIAVFSLFVAIVISTAITPAVDWLNVRGVPRAAGVVLVYLGLLAVLVGAGLLLVPMLADQGTGIADSFGGFYLSVVNTLRLSPSRLIRRLAWQLPGEVSMAPAAEASPDALDTLARALGYLGLIGDGLFVFLAVLLLAFYWTLDRDRVLRSLLLLLPPDGRAGARDLFVASERKVGGYIRGVAVLCLIVGALSFGAYLLIGLPNALILGLVAGLFEAIPVIGPALGAIPAVAVAVANDSGKVVWVLAALAVIQLLENMVLVPRVMGRAVGVNPVVTLLSLAAFSRLFGVPGAIMAIPLAAVIQLLLDRFVLGSPVVEAPATLGRDRLSVLRYEAQELVSDVRKHLRDKSAEVADDGDQVEDAVEALASDLDSLLARAAPQTESNGRTEPPRREGVP